MRMVLQAMDLRNKAESFKDVATQRLDVEVSNVKLVSLFREVIQKANEIREDKLGFLTCMKPP
jgi:hypothetical protein